MPLRRRGDPREREVKKGPWSPEEDEVLRQHVEEHGTQDWSSIQSKGLLCRSGKSCRLRWVNKLQPGLKVGKFSREEERVVLSMQAEFGNRWAQIATHLPGRTDNDVKNFWSTRQKRLARLERPPRIRAVSHQRGNASSALSLELRAHQEPSSSMTAFHATAEFDVGQSSSQEPHIDAPSPGVLCLPAPDDTSMEMEPGSSSMVPFGTYAGNPVPGAGADLASLQFGRNGSTSSALSRQEPSSSKITFQASTCEYEVGQSSSQEPHETMHCIDAPLPGGVLCLPAPLDTAIVESGSSSVVRPTAGADLASLHDAAFVEPLAVVPTAPLSFGRDYGDGRVGSARKVMPADPFSCLDDHHFVAAPRRCMSEVRFDDLSPETLAFIDQRVYQVQNGKVLG